MNSVVRSVVGSVPGPINKDPASGGGGAPGEFITNGTFDTDTNWTKQLGWTIAAGVASNSGTNGQLSQNFGALVAPLVSGSNYLLTFDLVNPSLGLVEVSFNDMQAVYGATTSGVARIAEFTANGDWTVIQFLSADEVPISVDNVSLVAT